MAEPPLLTITTVGYEYEHEWEVFINCLLLQTDSRWFCQLINDGPDPKAREICRKYIERFPQHFSYQETPVRMNDWGHTLRALGLAEAKTTFWATQNADNYLMPRYVELTVEEMARKGYDLLIFPCVHNYANVNPPKSPPYAVLDVAPRKTRCDAGSMMVRTEYAKIIGWNHRSELADGDFIDEAMKGGPRWGQLESVLMVHN